MRLGDAREPRERGGAVATGSVGFTERERRIRPSRLESRRFAQLAQTRLVFTGKKAADEVLERVEAEGPLSSGEFLEGQWVCLVVGGQQVPHNAGVEVHQGRKRPRVARGREQSGRV